MASNMSTPCPVKKNNKNNRNNTGRFYTIGSEVKTQLKDDSSVLHNMQKVG